MSACANRNLQRAAIELTATNSMGMVEVFKTNVNDEDHATALIDQIHEVYSDYQANFDLDDCDRILRVKSKVGFVHAKGIQHLLQRFGYDAEILIDDPAISHNNSNDETFIEPAGDTKLTRGLCTSRVRLHFGTESFD